MYGASERTKYGGYECAETMQKILLKISTKNERNLIKKNYINSIFKKPFEHWPFEWSVFKMPVTNIETCKAKLSFELFSLCFFFKQVETKKKREISFFRLKYRENSWKCFWYGLNHLNNTNTQKREQNFFKDFLFFLHFPHLFTHKYKDSDSEQ